MPRNRSVAPTTGPINWSTQAGSTAPNSRASDPRNATTAAWPRAYSEPSSSARRCSGTNRGGWAGCGWLEVSGRTSWIVSSSGPPWACSWPAVAACSWTASWSSSAASAVVVVEVTSVIAARWSQSKARRPRVGLGGPWAPAGTAHDLDQPIVGQAVSGDAIAAGHRLGGDEGVDDRLLGRLDGGLEQRIDRPVDHAPNPDAAIADRLRL